MRDFINLSKTENISILNQFPNLMEIINCEGSDLYKVLSVCPFDHFLSKEDASKEIDNVSANNANQYNLKLYSFIVSLGLKTEILSVKICGRKRDKLKLRKFTSSEALRKKLKLKHHFAPNSHRFILLLPEFEAIYFENWDFTHHIFSKQNIRNTVIEELTTNNGLYLIE